MLAIFILAGIACFVAICTLFNHYYIIPLPQKKQELRIIAEGEIPHIEALLRELYALLQRKRWFEPQFINTCSGESHTIMEKFCQSHALPLRESVPRGNVRTLYLNSYSNMKSIKQELYALRNEIELKKVKEHRNA